MSRPFISLCMIVKNEAERITACLQSARDVVDEIIITDTGSTDGTMDICRSMGASVDSRKWDDSFAKARNAGIARATGGGFYGWMRMKNWITMRVDSCASL
ncbi:hypothetical protein ASL14_03235 [Paenibacillus sp. IHB B 3084]|uniref:glycosyltransferase n=1 Tax=Paenibacillus sp. IHB B 3084 TaxID=867076 RepID=UPI000720F4BB|nr:glycosyltransferase [Paenibacillus sp. IHB B 3084]ALP35339.1 hypothetical protein ASL14_03235 [Paenibacillus sp. IHB B 3084]